MRVLNLVADAASDDDGQSSRHRQRPEPIDQSVPRAAVAIEGIRVVADVADSRIEHGGPDDDAELAHWDSPCSSKLRGVAAAHISRRIRAKTSRQLQEASRPACIDRVHRLPLAHYR
jgi:hypothetical protein